MEKDERKFLIKLIAISAVIITLISLIPVATYFLNQPTQGSWFGPATVFPHPKIVVDSSNNAHVLWYQMLDSLDDSGVYYAKINSEGRLIYNQKIIHFNESQGGENQGFSVYIDPSDFIHLRYGNRYAKIDSNGKVIEKDIPLAEKLVFPGLSIFKYSDNGYASFSDCEVIHSDGLIYSITNPQDELKLTIYNLNGTVLIDRNITTNIPTFSLRILIDNINNIHIFLKNAQFLPDSYTYYTKVNKTGEVLVNTSFILDQVMDDYTILFNEDEINISYLDDDTWNLHLLRLNLNGALINEYTVLDEATYGYPMFAIDNNGNYCFVAECELSDFTFFKLDRDYNTIVHPFVINKEPMDTMVLLSITGIIIILVLVPILFFNRRRKKKQIKDNRGSEIHE